ncbi:MAG TPA: pyruvate dehydrogenase (acetyl-transferring) E1 component subunit alpha [Gammaproteobacteria bacterium]|nr:pyruvate dehydrogenase (acetyl-transferring) E1 component subunit alpha [Gammaproteobacteria bacterium]
MDRETLHQFLHDMLLARAFEERAAQEYSEGRFSGFLHLYPGEEAVAVGVIHATEPADYLVTTYREHVHALVRGIPARQVMAELFGRRDGICRGMGGSMHLFDRERRFMGGYAIVGETFPVATGIGYSIALRRLPEVVVCFFGDGAVNQGTFHEALNMASLWKLPVLFVCENNHYQIGTEIHRHSAVVDVYRRACSYDMPAEKIDGMDVITVYEATRHALAQIRSGSGPQLLEFETYRFRGHSMADPGSYRPRAELYAHTEHDPVRAVIDKATFGYPSPGEIAAAGPDVVAQLVCHPSAIDHLEQKHVDEVKREVEAIVEDAVKYALQSPSPSMEDAWHSLYCNRRHETLLGVDDG